MSRILSVLRDELELEGYVPGTEEYERLYLARRVTKCQEMQGVPSCPDCRAYVDCDLARNYMINVKYGRKVEK